MAHKTSFRNKSNVANERVNMLQGSHAAMAFRSPQPATMYNDNRLAHIYTVTQSQRYAELEPAGVTLPIDPAFSSRLKTNASNRLSTLFTPPPMISAYYPPTHSEAMTLFNPGANPLLLFAVGEDEDPAMAFPRMHVSWRGTMTIILSERIFIEMTVNKNFRICVTDRVAVASNWMGTVNGIVHPQGKIYQDNNSVEAVITNRGHCFDFDDTDSEGESVRLWALNRLGMWKITENKKFVMAQRPEFPDSLTMYDQSLLAFYDHAKCGPKYSRSAQKLVNSAIHWRAHRSGDQHVVINGIQIRKRNSTGEVFVRDHRRHVIVNTMNDSVWLQHGGVELSIGMGPNSNLQMVAKRGAKSVHASESRLVVENGSGSAAFDRFLSLLLTHKSNSSKRTGRK